MALETEFVSSNPSHGEVVISVGFFLLLLHFIHHSSIQYVACPVLPLLGCNTTLGSSPSLTNKQFVTARGDHFEKILSVPPVWQKNMDISMFGASKKSLQSGVGIA